MEQDLKRLTDPDRIELINILKAQNLFYMPAESPGRALEGKQMFDALNSLKGKDDETYEYVRKRLKHMIDVFGVTGKYMQKLQNVKWTT